MTSVHLLTSQRKSSYQGFTKYQDEMNRYEGNPLVAGLPNNGHSRNQSLSNGAGQAAMAALRIHQQQPQQPQSPQQAQQKRNPTTSNIKRSNSLQTYTYHPKGSYIPGQATINNPNAPRHSSLTSRNSYQAPKRLNSLNSQNSNRRTYVPQYTETEELEEEETIITTKTTKVVDSLGRTQSITTKTIKTLPDGSNIIETTTKNISRSNSRTNSLTSGRASSMVSNGNANINLTRIEEDLQDFDYNYELDNEHVHDLNHHKLKLNVHEDGNATGSPLKELRGLKPAVDRVNSITSLEHYNPISTDSSPQKPLRSILKNTQRPKFEDDEAAEQDSSDKLQHPYKNLSSKLDKPPSIKPPTIPLNDSASSHTVKNSLKNQVVPNFASPKIIHHDDVSSNFSGASQNSIKFDERVETFPIYSHGRISSSLRQAPTPLPKVVAMKDPKTDPDFYAAAMKAAYKKVYGDAIPEQESSPVQAYSPVQASSPVQAYSPVQASPKQTDTFIPPSVEDPKLPTYEDLTGLVEHKVKREKNSEQPQGIEADFRYENHHKDFVKHSLRDQIPKSSSRKDRSKQESKAIKEAEKNLIKEAKLEEKRAHEEEKKAQAAERISRKEDKKASRKMFGFFGKRRTSTDTQGYDTTESVISEIEDRSQLDRPVSHSTKPIDTIEESDIQQHSSLLNPNNADTYTEQDIRKASSETSDLVSKNETIIPETKLEVIPIVGGVIVPSKFVEKESIPESSVERNTTSTSTPYMSDSANDHLTPEFKNSSPIPVPHLNEIEDPAFTDHESLMDNEYLEDNPSVEGKDITQQEKDITQQEKDIIQQEPDVAISQAHLQQPEIHIQPKSTIEPESQIQPESTIGPESHIIESTMQPEIHTQPETAINQVETPLFNQVENHVLPEQAIEDQDIQLAEPEIIDAIQLIPQGETVTSSTDSPIPDNEIIEIPPLESSSSKKNESNDESVQEQGGLSIAEEKSTIATPQSNPKQFDTDIPSTTDVHNFDGNITVNKKEEKKKPSKFRQKILKYFINGYDRHDK